MFIFLFPYLFFFFVVPYYCLKTAWSDPGILRRLTNPISSVKEDNPDEYDETGRIVAKLLFHQLNDNFVVGKQILVDNEYVFLKYCHTCQLFRPPKASHCHHCDNCVEEFDHHCHWLSNCIGRRNYRSFILFIFYLSIAALYNSAFMATYIYKNNSESSSISTAAKNIFSSSNSYFLLFSISVGLTLTFLFCYHIMLMGNDLTTAEHIKKIRTTSFSWSVCRSNLYRVFFHPVPETQIQWDLYTHRSNYDDTQV
jgi:palmitoyltransferase ZDHHC9/14/18